MGSWTGIGTVAAAAAFSVLAATAVVDAQSSGEPLEACAGDRGMLRLVASGEACVTGERRVSWNVVGPIGPPGASGPPGATGARGPAGPRGRTGRVQLKLSGDAQVVVALNLLNKRVKALGEKLSAMDGKLTAVDGKVGKAATLGQRAYERIYHVCLGVESAKAAFGSTPATVGITRCKYGFYKGFAGYDPQP
jgi:hypothetical protein